MSGLRYNEFKRRWGLLSWPAIEQLVKVLEMGAVKYDDWNWSKGLSFSETFESTMRHLTAWYAGEDKDEESGLSHMAHVLCNAMFLMHFILMGTGRDDRPVALQDKQDEGESIGEAYHKDLGRLGWNTAWPVAPEPSEDPDEQPVFTIADYLAAERADAKAARVTIGPDGYPTANSVDIEYNRADDTLVVSRSTDVQANVRPPPSKL